MLGDHFKHQQKAQKNAKNVALNRLWKGNVLTEWGLELRCRAWPSSASAGNTSSEDSDFAPLCSGLWATDRKSIVFDLGDYRWILVRRRIHRCKGLQRLRVSGTLGSLACVCAFVHVFPVQARRQRRHLTPSSLRSPAWGDDVNTPGITLIKTKVAEAGDPIPWACLEMKVSLLSFGSWLGWH